MKYTTDELFVIANEMAPQYMACVFTADEIGEEFGSCSVRELVEIFRNVDFEKPFIAFDEEKLRAGEYKAFSIDRDGLEEFLVKRYGNDVFAEYEAMK